MIRDTVLLQSSMSYNIPVRWGTDTCLTISYSGMDLDGSLCPNYVRSGTTYQLVDGGHDDTPIGFESFGLWTFFTFHGITWRN